jgi:hypothetical protein
LTVSTWYSMSMSPHNSGHTLVLIIEEVPASDLDEHELGVSDHRAMTMSVTTPAGELHLKCTIKFRKVTSHIPLPGICSSYPTSWRKGRPV